MAMENNPEKKPLGDRIRDLINPALEDERRREIQLKILDDLFLEVAQMFPSLMEQSFSAFFNEAAQKKSLADKNAFVIKYITTGSKDRKSYSPLLQLGLPVITGFTNFSAEDIKNLPGYIKLHVTARTHNVALKIKGLTAEEAKSDNPAIIVDGMKTYEQGAMENYQLYPNLPPESQKPFDSKGPGPGTFRF